MKLNIKAFAIAFGVWWGIGLFILALWMSAMQGMNGQGWMMQGVYPGYSWSIAGAFIGLAWGFVCGVICGAILAWLYNFFCDRFSST